MDKQLHGLDLLQNPHKSKKTNKFFKINHGLQSTTDKSTNTENIGDETSQLSLENFKNAIRKDIASFNPEQYHLQSKNPYYLFLFSYYQLYLSREKMLPPKV